ncbi:MAG: hypothetical protein AAGB46_18235 [Verrucomicrobiota bacterium]
MQSYARQFDNLWENRENNFAEVSCLLETADIRPENRIDLSETFSKGCCAHMRVLKVAERDSSTTGSFLANKTRKYQAYVICGLGYLNENERASTPRPPSTPTAIESDPTPSSNSLTCPRPSVMEGYDSPNQTTYASAQSLNSNQSTTTNGVESLLPSAK